MNLIYSKILPIDWYQRLSDFNVLKKIKRCEISNINGQRWFTNTELNISGQAVFKRLQEIEMIQKTSRWLLNELNDTHKERLKSIWEILLVRYKIKAFLHRTIYGDEKRISFENSMTKKHGVTQTQHSFRLQERITWAERRCFVFGGSRSECFITNC